MEAKLTELVTRLKAAAEANLKSVVLYGSAVTAEFRAGHSDLNILCIVERAASEDLERLHEASEWWVRQGNPPPLLFTLDELRKSADVFAIELLDITQHHRLLLGTDFFANFEVPLHLHRLQVERELRADWLRLRQAILAAPLSYKAHLGIMSQSVSIFCALFRHAVWALGQPMPASKREAVAAVAALTGADPSAFHALLDVREGKRKPRQIDVEASLHAYLEFVEVVTSEVDRRLDALG
jgi:predicted nucleotidyltransferase